MPLHREGRWTRGGLAQPLPADVIAAMFEIPAVSRTSFQSASDAMAKFFGGTLGDPLRTPGRPMRPRLSWRRSSSRCLKNADSRPGDDLMSLFVAGQEAGKLSPQEVCCQCVMLLVAGHVTTINQLSNAVHALVTNPDQLQLLRQVARIAGSGGGRSSAVRRRGAIHQSRRKTGRVAWRQNHPCRGQLVFLSATGRQSRSGRLRDAAPLRHHSSKQLRTWRSGTGRTFAWAGTLARLELEVGLSTLLGAVSEPASRRGPARQAQLLKSHVPRLPFAECCCNDSAAKGDDRADRRGALDKFISRPDVGVTVGLSGEKMASDCRRECVGHVDPPFVGS